LWDQILGSRWDLLVSGTGVDGTDAVIKMMRFTLREDFMLRNIQIQFLLLDGNFKNCENYRGTVISNSTASKAAYIAACNNEL
jgi:hypothetical protein